MAAGRVEVLPATHPDVVGMLAARRAAYPHWAAGWDVPAGDQFVTVYEGGRPAAGAAIRHGPDGISRVSRLCGAGPDDTQGSALLTALEALARDAGSTRLRLDSSAFLDDAHVPWQRHGYVTGPPYDGDADVEVWVERTVDPTA